MSHPSISGVLNDVDPVNKASRASPAQPRHLNDVASIVVHDSIAPEVRPHSYMLSESLHKAYCHTQLETREQREKDKNIYHMVATNGERTGQV